MNAIICKIQIHLPFSHSLKDKRQIIKSITSRIRNSYNISVAEVDDNELWQIATIGIAYISNSQAHNGNIMDSILNFIKANYPEIEITNHEIETLYGF